MPRILLHKRFVESLEPLSRAERSSVQRLLLMLRDGNVTSGMRPHKVGAFLSLSPNMDLRVIAVQYGDEITFVNIGHHDVAYRWAEQHGILVTETNSVELIDAQSLPLSSSDHVVSLPIPVKDVLSIQDDDLFLQAIIDMSPEWQEWLFSEYTGESTSTPPPVSSSLVFSPLDDEELAQALDLNAETWQLFLHPNQRDAVTDRSHLSIAVTGGPGTGKTVVLLNRILMHGPKGKEEDLSILLTYSANLAGYLYDRLSSERANRHFRVLPLQFLTGEWSSQPRKGEADRYKFRLADGRLAVKYQDGPFRIVRELLVDELQDAPNEVLRTLTNVMASASTRVILAADLDQSIHRANRETVNSLIESCAKHYSLSYCYRSTRQILEKALAWLSTSDRAPTSGRTFALSGPRVRFVPVKGLEEQVEVAVEVFRDLARRYDPGSLCLIYCQYFNPSFKGPSKEEETLKAHPDLKRYYNFASTTKGKEYFAGVVFVSSTFLAKDLGPHGNELRENTLYVALTRFRDELTVVYSEGCAIEERLQRMSI